MGKKKHGSTGKIKSLSDLINLIRSIEDNLIVNKPPQSDLSTFPIINLLLACAMAAWQSQQMQTDAIELVNRVKSTNKLLSHLASDPPFSKATNFDSIMNLTMQVSLNNFQETTLSTSVNIYSLVDFTSSVSEIQLAS